MPRSTRLRLVDSPPTSPRPQRWCFGRFELQADEQRLLVDGQPSPLRARALAVLIALAERAGQLVSRQQLLDRVWPGLVVEENNLSVQINALRKVLGSDIVVTIPGRGYRFAAQVDNPPERAASAAVNPVAANAAALRTNLPDQLPALIGRHDELAALAALVDSQPLVTVLGAGGIGKTRLAQALLHARRGQYAHGVCFVDLAPLRPGDAVVDAVATALGIPQPGEQQSVEATVQAMVRALAPLDILIALDNAEHVIDVVAGLAAALAAGAPRVRLLVTSQAPLRVAAEWVHRLGALAIPAGTVDAQAALQFGAVALFVQRAQGVDRRFALTDAMVAPVVRLCQRLDGSPLAIELAAARAPLLGLASIVASLDQRLGLLTTGRRDAPPRQQTLRAALAWSHGLLSPAEQAVFRRLSVFIGSASLASALQVLGGDAVDGLDESAVLDAMATLVDRSLVELVDGPAGATDLPRYRLLDTPLAYAREQLRASDEHAAIQRRHALTLRAMFARARDDLYGGQWLYNAFKPALDPDMENGFAALCWAVANDPATALVIAPVLSRNLFGRRPAECKAVWQLAESLIDAAASTSHPPAVSSTILARATLECAVYWRYKRQSHSHDRARQAARLAALADDRPTQYLALSLVAWGCGTTGDLPGLRQAAAEMRAIRQPGWSAFIDAEASHFEYVEHELAGDLSGALIALQSQADRSRAAGLGDAWQLGNQVPILLQAGRIDEAIQIALQLTGRAPGARSRGMLRHNLNKLIRAYLAKGATHEARDGLVALWPMAQQHDMQAAFADNAALLAALDQRPRDALALAGYADAALAASGTRRLATEQQMTDRVDRLARATLAAPTGAGLDDTALDALRAAGAALPEAAMLTLALAAGLG